MKSGRWSGVVGTGLATALLGGCMLAPYDGQVVSGTTTQLAPWGVWYGANVPVALEARSTTTGSFQTVSTTSSTTQTVTLFGVPWNQWFAPTQALPSWAWRSGVVGSRAEVRATSSGTLAYSFRSDGQTCLVNQSNLGVSPSEGVTACATDPSPSAFVFTNNYRGMPTFSAQSPVDVPKELDHGLTEEIQGVATTSTHWFFAHNKDYWNDPNIPDMIRIPITAPLEQRSTWDAALVVPMPQALLSLGYDHFGDPDEHNGRIYVPVEQKEDYGIPGAIAEFDTNLNYLGYAILARDNAPWVAVDPTTGLMYTSNGRAGVQSVDVYSMSFTNGHLSGLLKTDDRRLWERNGQLVQPFYRIQGGAFSARGNLYLSVDGRVESATAPVGVFGFEAGSFRREVWFDVPYDTSNDEELEGLEVRDLTGVGAPGITGQLHVVMLDNDDTTNDDLYFKHYLAPASELGFL